jgi:hypothetical protein
MQMMDSQSLYDAVLQGDSVSAGQFARLALDHGGEPWDIFSSAVMPAMEEARRRFACGEFYMPEMLLASRAMRAAVQPLRPRLVASGIEPRAHVLVMNLFGGPGNVVASLAVDMLEGAGFKVSQAVLSLRVGEWNSVFASINADAILLVLPIICCPPGSRSLDGLVRRAIAEFKELTGPGTPRLALVGVRADLGTDLGIEAYTDDLAQVVRLVDRLIDADRARRRP